MSRNRAVYVVRPLVDEYQFLQVDSPDYAATLPLKFDGARIERASWKSPPLYVGTVSKPAPDVWSIWSSASLAFDRADVEALGCVVAMSGQLLPLDAPGKDLQVLNITEVVDCFDPSSYPDDSFGVPERYVFIAHRLPEASLFKIPDSSMVEVLCIQEPDPDEPGFKDIYEARGWRGLDFEPVWREDIGPIGTGIRIDF